MSILSKAYHRKYLNHPKKPQDNSIFNILKRNERERDGVIQPEHR